MVGVMLGGVRVFVFRCGMRLYLGGSDEVVVMFRVEIISP